MNKQTQLTDALNATYLTYNGNEMMIQNDMGNTPIQDKTTGVLAQLSDGFIPVGMKEFGGMLYIASYNPTTKEGEVGTFPSPLITYDFDSEAEKIEDSITSTNADSLNSKVSINSTYFDSLKPFYLSEQYLSAGDAFLPVIDLEFSDQNINTVRLNRSYQGGSKSYPFISTENEKGYYTLDLYADVFNSGLRNISVDQNLFVEGGINRWFASSSNFDKYLKTRKFQVYPNISRGRLKVVPTINMPQEIKCIKNNIVNDYIPGYIETNNPKTPYQLVFPGLQFKDNGPIWIDQITIDSIIIDGAETKINQSINTPNFQYDNGIVYWKTSNGISDYSNYQKDSWIYNLTQEQLDQNITLNLSLYSKVPTVQIRKINNTTEIKWDANEGIYYLLGTYSTTFNLSRGISSETVSFNEFAVDQKPINNIDQIKKELSIFETDDYSASEERWVQLCPSVIVPILGPSPNSVRKSYKQTGKFSWPYLGVVAPERYEDKTHTFNYNLNQLIPGGQFQEVYPCDADSRQKIGNWLPNNKSDEFLYYPMFLFDAIYYTRTKNGYTPPANQDLRENLNSDYKVGTCLMPEWAKMGNKNIIFPSYRRLTSVGQQLIDNLPEQNLKLIGMDKIKEVFISIVSSELEKVLPHCYIDQKTPIDCGYKIAESGGNENSVIKVGDVTILDEKIDDHNVKANTFPTYLQLYQNGNAEMYEDGTYTAYEKFGVELPNPFGPIKRPAPYYLAVWDTGDYKWGRSKSRFAITRWFSTLKNSNTDCFSVLVKSNKNYDRYHYYIRKAIDVQGPGTHNVTFDLGVNFSNNQKLYSQSYIYKKNIIEVNDVGDMGKPSCIVLSRDEGAKSDNDKGTITVEDEKGKIVLNKTLQEEQILAGDIIKMNLLYVGDKHPYLNTNDIKYTVEINYSNSSTEQHPQDIFGMCFNSVPRYEVVVNDETPSKLPVYIALDNQYIYNDKVYYTNINNSALTQLTAGVSINHTLSSNSVKTSIDLDDSYKLVKGSEISLKNTDSTAWYLIQFNVGNTEGLICTWNRPSINGRFYKTKSIGTAKTVMIFVKGDEDKDFTLDFNNGDALINNIDIYKVNSTKISNYLDSIITSSHVSTNSTGAEANMIILNQEHINNQAMAEIRYQDVFVLKEDNKCAFDEFNCTIPCPINEANIIGTYTFNDARTEIIINSDIAPENIKNQVTKYLLENYGANN